MPSAAFSKQSPTSVKADAVAVFAVKEGDAAVPTADAVALAEVLDVDLAEELKALRFDGSPGTAARIATRGKAKAPAVLVVGVGERAKATPEALRRGAGTAARNALQGESLAVVVPADLVEDAEAADLAQAATEGALLGAYAFNHYRSSDEGAPKLQTVSVLAGEGAAASAVKKGVTAGAAVAAAVATTRDLVNTPPQAKRPPALAERINELAKDAGIKVKIHDEKALAKGGFGGILGVGQGSAEAPRLVELTYAPARAKQHVVFVGKGITFDTGGISLKPSNAMNTMKSDMAGAATVVGTMLAAAALGLKVKITGLCALAENMPSGTATRVSDVLTHRGGKTVEVMNTDAEGRLVMADALAYGAESSPDLMIDVATLTGAQVVALGSKVSAVMSTDAELAQALLGAAGAVGEGLWELPLVEDYREHLKSPVADLKNIGKAGEAGTIVAGLFLKEFTGDVPWAHLDIAGPSFTEEGDAFYNGRGATGSPVRTLVRFLADRAG
jgi:leucyl aminopeptidase